MRLEKNGYEIENKNNWSFFINIQTPYIKHDSHQKIYFELFVFIHHGDINSL